MSDKHYVHPPDETELAKVLRESRSWFDTYGTTLIYAVAAVLAVTAVTVYVQRKPPATAPASAALLLATTPEEYQDVADQFENTEIGIRARLRQADLLLNNAVGNMFTDRAAAQKELESAQKAYERLADRSDVSRDVRERVLVGLARVLETQCDGSPAKTDAAVAAWKRVLDEFPDSKVFKSIAEERIRRLPLDSTKNFYTWFQQQNPKRQEDLLMPQDRPATVPDVPSSFELPNISLPGAGETPAGETPAATTPPGDKPAAETPAQPAPAPAEPQPAADKPAEPAPADNQPAAPAPAAPATDAPKPDAPPADAPKADAPPTDAPRTEAPPTDAPQPAAEPGKSGA